MWRWLAQNKQWLFSGAAISIIAVVLSLLKKLVQKDKTATTPAALVGSNSATRTQLSINVSPTISPVISPTVSPSQSSVQTATARDVQNPATHPTPDVKAVNFKAVFARGMGPAGKNCFVVSFRNDG